MIIEIDESLKVCYANKYLEERIRQHLRDETLAYITDQKRGFITLYNKPLATLTIKGWGRTEQRNVIVYCSLSWTATSKNDSLVTHTENTLQDIKNAEEKLNEVTTYSVEQLPAIPVWVPYKSLNNLVECSCRVRNRIYEALRSRYISGATGERRVIQSRRISGSV